jgi:hypothetical protein
MKLHSIAVESKCMSGAIPSFVVIYRRSVALWHNNALTQGSTVALGLSLHAIGELSTS